ncbi:hypothetical protein PBI_SCTP2_343 [Salicola phage SCTP-2]|nr:hypothetical protein PBI_SCTP2_343 [Salicola phage SCTP-2]
MTEKRRVNVLYNKSHRIDIDPIGFYIFTDHLNDDCLTYSGVKQYNDNLLDRVYKNVKRVCYRYFITKFRENNIKTYWMNVSISIVYNDVERDSYNRSGMYPYILEAQIYIFTTQHDFNRLKLTDYSLCNILNNLDTAELNDKSIESIKIEL